jgi:hypothetical protein
VVGRFSVVPSVLKMVGRSTRRCMDVGKRRTCIHTYLLENDLCACNLTLQLVSAEARGLKDSFCAKGPV